MLSRLIAAMQRRFGPPIRRWKVKRIEARLLKFRRSQEVGRSTILRLRSERADLLKVDGLTVREPETAASKRVTKQKALTDWKVTP